MSGVSSFKMLHFGKLPSRGDFVRGGQPVGLIQVLDDWLTRGIESLANDPRWKTLYDRAAPVRFAFLGTRSQKALAGHLIASSDASGRRFPFIGAAALDIGDPMAFVARSPLLLSRTWQRIEGATTLAFAAHDAAPVLAAMTQAEVELERSAQAYDANYRDFLEMQTLGQLEAALGTGGNAVSLRRLILGIGLLLQPVLSSGVQRLDKGLVLPLPREPMLRPYVATLWLELVGGFLSRGAFELLLFLPDGGGAAAAELVIGFDGPSSKLLHALIDRQYGEQVFIDANASEWVEEFVEQHYNVKKLSSYLEQPQLSLAQAVTSFNEAFLGS